MISFCRTVTTTAEFLDNETVRFRGALEDHIYAMGIEMDVRIADGVISAIKGVMQRHTTPWCPDAEPVLEQAVGLSVRQSGWVSRINRDIGRKGCRHFAELIIECGACLDTVRLGRSVAERLRQDSDASAGEVARSWIDEHPGAWVLEKPAGT